MKMNIEWHENCLMNRQKHINGEAREIERLTEILKRDQASFNFYLAQIELAKKENKNEFDSDKYAIKRLCV